MDDPAPYLSNRISKIARSASMETTEVAKKLSRERKIIDLSVGEPDFDTPDVIKEGAVLAIKEGKTKYTSGAGITELREKIAEKLKNENNIGYEADEVIVTPGTKQGLFYACASLLNPGDEVLIPEPCWVSYSEIVKINGGVPVPVSTTESSRFKPSVEDLEKKLTQRTKMLIINNPANPTGAFFPRKELEGILDFAIKGNLLVVADEVYEKIIFDDNEFVSMAALGEEAKARTITLNGFSKTNAMTGWRIGYVAANREWVKAMVKMQQQTATCPSSVTQYAALAALSNPQDYVDGMVSKYERRRDLLVKGLEEVGLRTVKPLGAFYAFPSIQKFNMSSAEASKFIIEKAGVVGVPGSAYGKSGEGYIRFSFSTSEENIKDAIESMLRTLK